MSASMHDPEAERDLLAAEYALGTLGAADRATLAREADTDPATRAAIESWERLLAPLSDAVAPVAPPAALWSRLEASSWGKSEAANANLPTRRLTDRQVRWWQGAAAAGFALAASIAGFAILRPSPAPGPRLITALLPAGQQGVVFVAEAMPDGGLLVRPVGNPHVAPGRDLELWLLREGETVPKPLGVLPISGIALAKGTLPPGRARILVSLEPRGGSPTGLPTGPVLFGGSI